MNNLESGRVSEEEQKIKEEEEQKIKEEIDQINQRLKYYTSIGENFNLCGVSEKEQKMQEEMTEKELEQNAKEEIDQMIQRLKFYTSTCKNFNLHGYYTELTKVAISFKESKPNINIDDNGNRFPKSKLIKF